MKLNEAEAWREFWRDVLRIAQRQLQRAEADVRRLARGTTERRRASRIARGHAHMVGHRFRVLDELTMQRANAL